MHTKNDFLFVVLTNKEGQITLIIIVFYDGVSSLVRVKRDAAYLT